MTFAAHVPIVALVVTLSGGFAAQPKKACGLLKPGDLQPIAGSASVKDGVELKSDSLGNVTCRYQWGTGAAEFSLDVQIGSQAKTWPGLKIDTIKAGLLNMKNTTEIPGLGDGSIVQTTRPMEIATMTLIKGQLLSITLDGRDAEKKKDSLIAVTRVAASKL